jgi:hypothetical protein
MSTSSKKAVAPTQRRVARCEECRAQKSYCIGRYGWPLGWSQRGKSRFGTTYHKNAVAWHCPKHSRLRADVLRRYVDLRVESRAAQPQEPTTQEVIEIDESGKVHESFIEPNPCAAQPQGSERLEQVRKDIDKAWSKSSEQPQEWSPIANRVRSALQAIGWVDEEIRMAFNSIAAQPQPQEWTLGRRDDNYTIITGTCEVVIGFGAVARSRAEVLIDAHNGSLKINHE